MPGMSDESDRAGFLRAIIGAPDDDLPREIFADYLDERGDPLGEFIRVQVELAKWNPCSECNGSGHRTAIRFTTECPFCRKPRALRRREQNLLDAHESGMAPNWRRWFASDLPVKRSDLTYRRGFVTNLTLSWADWSAHADALLAAAPIRGRLVNGEYRGGGTVTLTSWPRISQRYDEAADVTDFRLGNRAAVVRLTRAELERTAGRSVPAGREIATRLLAAEFPGVRFVPPTVGRLSDPARLRDRLASADIVS